MTNYFTRRSKVYYKGWGDRYRKWMSRGKGRTQRAFNFNNQVKIEAWIRQRKKCASCGQSLETDRYDAHHVIPNQCGKKNADQDAWLRSSVNCVLLCEDCHIFAHNGHYSSQKVEHPEIFKFSHGGDRLSHTQWVKEIIEKTMNSSWVAR